MGEKTIGFVEKAYDFARQNPKLVPPYLELDAFGVDFSDAHGLWTLLNTVQQLEEGIGDTEMTAGSEAYQSALVFYKSVKMAAASNRGSRTFPAQRRSMKNSRPGSRVESVEPKVRSPAIRKRRA
ncbi:MAG: hypothetical protein LBK73_08195 [Treponema sp.]|jgi:hypothetical protein|nr:hypothetical protein [Treponema sp.]